MKDDKITERIFDLVSTKPFESLSEEERKVALAEITEEEYRNMYELFQSAGGVIKQNPVTPSDNIKQELLIAFDRRYQKRNPIVALLSARVPVYWVVAAMLLAAIYIAGWQHFNPFSSQRDPGVVYKVKTDTVYVLADSTKIEPNKNPQALCRSIKTDSSLKRFMVTSLYAAGI